MIINDKKNEILTLKNEIYTHYSNLLDATNYTFSDAYIGGLDNKIALKSQISSALDVVVNNIDLYFQALNDSILSKSKEMLLSLSSYVVSSYSYTVDDVNCPVVNDVFGVKDLTDVYAFFGLLDSELPTPQEYALWFTIEADNTNLPSHNGKIITNQSYTTFITDIADILIYNDLDKLSQLEIDMSNSGSRDKLLYQVLMKPSIISNESFDFKTFIYNETVGEVKGLNLKECLDSFGWQIKGFN